VFDFFFCLSGFVFGFVSELIVGIFVLKFFVVVEGVIGFLGLFFGLIRFVIYGIVFFDGCFGCGFYFLWCG